jgi:hypothetical protein
VRKVITRDLNQLSELFNRLRRCIDRRDSIEESIDDIGIGVCDALIVPPRFTCEPRSSSRDENRNDSDGHSNGYEHVDDDRYGIRHDPNPNAEPGQRAVWIAIRAGDWRVWRGSHPLCV